MLYGRKNTALKDFCKNRNFEGALKQFGGDYKRLSEEIFRGKSEFGGAEGRGLERILNVAINVEKHRRGIDAHAIRILREELEKEKPMIHTIFKAVYWLFRVLSPIDFKEDVSIEQKVELAEKLLERKSELIRIAEEHEKKRLKSALEWTDWGLAQIRKEKGLNPYAMT